MFVLLSSVALMAQVQTVQVQTAQIPATQTPVSPSAAKPVVRAQYSWGYSGMDGEGTGTLSILVDPATGKVILELHGVGERLVLLTGDQAAGYHIQIPRQNLDKTAPSFGALPIPFLPRLGSAEGLYQLLVEGKAPGVKVSKHDAQGPVKLRYSGQDANGKDVMVWLDRKRWER
jgi:hypothetical protein